MTEPQQPKAAPTNNQTTDQAMDEILERIAIYTANQYGGFEGFEDEDREILAKAKAQVSQLLANEVRKAETRAREFHFQAILPDEGPEEATKGTFAGGYAKAVEDICDAHYKVLKLVKGDPK